MVCSDKGFEMENGNVRIAPYNSGQITAVPEAREGPEFGRGKEWTLDPLEGVWPPAS